MVNGSIPRGIEDTVAVADGLELEGGDRKTFINTWQQEQSLHYPSQSIAVGTFAGWLKVHRLVSQPKQGRLLGVSGDMYHEWEVGTTVPDDHKVRVAAIAMEADVEEGLRLARADRGKSVTQRVADVRAARGTGLQR